MIVSSDAVCRKVHLYFQQNRRSYIESTFNISYKYFKHLYLNSYAKDVKCMKTAVNLFLSQGQKIISPKFEWRFGKISGLCRVFFKTSKRIYFIMQILRFLEHLIFFYFLCSGDIKMVIHYFVHY